jgi:molybdenum cofactor biosynthesis protein A
LLFDNHGRRISYLRLAVTDRCNLRCQYCMPMQGLDWLPKHDLLSYEEMLKVSSLLVSMGIDKIRITGGEPFIRKDLLKFLRALVKLDGLQQVSITTNGVLTAPFIPELKRLGIQSINLSLDTLDRHRFEMISRRDELHQVMATLEQLLSHGMHVKINAVVMEGKNTDDILPLVELTKHAPISVRFIEEMPFNGAGEIHALSWNHQRILDHIREAHPSLKKVDDPESSTAFIFSIDGYKGSVGVIPAYTRSFCGTCNRIRLTPQGIMKTCLYDGAGLDVKQLLRNGATDNMLAGKLTMAFQQKAKDGWEAEKQRFTQSAGFESMATIGG